VLRINVDETNIARAYDSKKGLVLTTRHRRKPVLLQQPQQTRGSFSHVAFICDDPSVQPRLPQLILGNEHVLPRRDLEALQSSLAPNVYLIRGKSSWLDHPTFCIALKWLARGLQNLGASHSFLLLLDCCYVHLHHSVLRTARKFHLRLCFVPKKTTWLLQPCDTHLFRRYKAYLRRAYHSLQLRKESSEITTQEMLKLVFEVIRFVLQGTQWEKAFSDNGYVLNQLGLCGRIKSTLPDLNLPDESSDPITFAEIREILPRGRIFEERLFLPPDVWTEAPGALVEESGPAMGFIDHDALVTAPASILDSRSGSYMEDTGPGPETQNSWQSRLRPRAHRSAAVSTSSRASECPPAPAVPIVSASSSSTCPLWMSPAAPLVTSPPAPEQQAPEIPRGRPLIPRTSRLS
jgi:hypothetical protein